MYYVVDTTNKIVISNKFNDWGLAYDFLRTVVMPSDYPDGGVLEIFNEYSTELTV